MKQSVKNYLGAATLLLAAGTASAAPDQGKLLATGGVSQVEGAGGGGLAPWALITGYGSQDSFGGNVHHTNIKTGDYSLVTQGMALGWHDRYEVSLAAQEFRGHLAPLDGLRLRQNILGLKWRFAGDAVVDQDRAMPQLALGLMVKQNQAVGGLGALGISNVRQLGAKHDQGLDIYLAATKLLLDQSLLLNGTLRATKANQMGLLGFGGDKHDRYQLMGEFSIGWLISRQWVAGMEYRMKPRNLTVDNEKDYYDAFVAFFPNKHVSITGAWVNLGDITIFNPKQQKGWHLSLQAGF
jgi:hypothetical protein